MKRIGVDIGGSHIGVGLVEESYIIAKKERDIAEEDKERIQEFIITTIVNAVTDLLKENNVEIQEIEKLGISGPGTIKNNLWIYSNNLKIDNFDICSKLKEYFSIPIYIKNDAKCAGLAEKVYGGLKEYSDGIFICLGTGFGSAVFLGGKLLESKTYPGFELGHIIIQKDGKQCTCGQRGCIETYCSMKRLKASIIEAFDLNPNISGEDLQIYVRSHLQDTKLEGIFEEFIKNLSIGLSSIINIFEPEIICLGGSFAYYEDILLDRLINYIRQNDLLFNHNDKERIKIEIAKFKNDAGIIGASVI